MTNITRGQRQIIHKLDTLNNLINESLGDRVRQVRSHNHSHSHSGDAELIKVPLIVSLAIGGLGILLLKAYAWRN